MTLKDAGDKKEKHERKTTEIIDAIRKLVDENEKKGVFDICSAEVQKKEANSTNISSAKLVTKTEDSDKTSQRITNDINNSSSPFSSLFPFLFSHALSSSSITAVVKEGKMEHLKKISDKYDVTMSIFVLLTGGS